MNATVGQLVFSLGVFCITIPVCHRICVHASCVCVCDMSVCISAYECHRMSPCACMLDFTTKPGLDTRDNGDNASVLSP